MINWIIAVLITIGTLFSLLAALGIVRMPVLYTRVQVVTKASTLGTSCLALAAALSFGSAEPAFRMLLVVAFLFFTAPVAAHMIGRAAKARNVPLWEGTVLDELTHGPQPLDTPRHEPPEVGR